jgi:hypothetical protein
MTMEALASDAAANQMQGRTFPRTGRAIFELHGPEHEVLIPGRSGGERVVELVTASPSSKAALASRCQVADGPVAVDRRGLG